MMAEVGFTGAEDEQLCAGMSGSSGEGEEGGEGGDEKGHNIPPPPRPPPYLQPKLQPESLLAKDFILSLMTH